MFLTFVFVLVLRTLVIDLGPVTTRTEFPDMASCNDAREAETLKARDRMMHAHCEKVKKDNEGEQ